MPKGSRIRDQFEQEIREMVMKNYGLPWWKVSDRVRGALDNQAMKAAQMPTASSDYTDLVENAGHVIARLLEEEGVRPK